MHNGRALGQAQIKAKEAKPSCQSPSVQVIAASDTNAENKSVFLYEIVRTNVSICRTKNQLWTRPCFGAGDACPCTRIGAHRGRRRRGLCTGRTYQGPVRASVAVVAWRAHGRRQARFGGGDAWAATSARGRGRRCRLARPQSCTRHGALDQQRGGAHGPDEAPGARGKRLSPVVKKPLLLCLK